MRRRDWFFLAVGILGLLLMLFGFIGGPAGAQSNQTTCAIAQTGPGTYNVTVSNMGTAANLIYEATVNDPAGYGVTTIISAYGNNAPTFTYGGFGAVPGTYSAQVSVLMGHGKNNAAPWYNFFKYSTQGSCSAVLS